MKTYYVHWTYIANYSDVIRVQAETPEQAIAITTGHYGDPFTKAATVCVFDAPPALIVHKGVRYDFDQYKRRV